MNTVGDGHIAGGGDIEAELYNMGKAEIPSTLLGDMVMERLKMLDNIAYVRFASVYREFTDITQLKKVVDNLVNGQDEGIYKGQLSLLPEDKAAPKTRYQRR
ncbi:ATP cone domain-containing protein [Dehalococcoides mccartyi]|uniref:ATP cone domain-containing protein n=1 Tax=Dehalococcoides mccartyi TaxID=61435 RepID=UPI001AF550D0|nr:ATP cone domain-containing protein [Dehalococcoides mccartyi]BCT55503.1 ribonucleotide reductase transcriptional regulator NrdR [Dehalococcoides mccartyi]